MAKQLQELDATHRIYQFTEGFSFGTDAVLLSGMIRCRERQVGVEFGTGVGIIPILLCMHKKFRSITALEIQSEYASLARENLEMNGFSDRVKVLCADLKDAPRIIEKPCDFVFCNPPYMKKDSGKTNDNEKKRIARHEILCDITDVCRSASAILKDKGSFYCVYRTARLPELFCALRENMLEPKNMILVTPLPDSAPSLVLIRAIKGGSCELKTRAPFVIQNPNGQRTEETRLLYETGVIRWGDENE